MNLLTGCTDPICSPLEHNPGYRNERDPDNKKAVVNALQQRVMPSRISGDLVPAQVWVLGLALTGLAAQREMIPSQWRRQVLTP